MSSKKVAAWWKYNPIMQKPISLDPVKPWSWFWYYGPDPASGASYGQYRDDDYDFDMLSAKADVVYSPATGKPMVFVSDISDDEIGDYFSQITSSVDFRTTCPHCKTSLLSDYGLEGVKIYCCCCGKEIAKQATASQINMEQKTMMKRSEALKRKVRANIAQQKQKDIALKKEEMISLDEIVAAMNDIEKEEKMQQKTRKALRVAAEGKKDEELISLDEITEAMESLDQSSDIAEAGEEDVVEDIDVSDENEIDDVSDESEVSPDDEEYFDLDMVLSMLNKKRRMQRKVKADDKETGKEKTDGVELAEEKKEECKLEEKKEECKLEEKKEENSEQALPTDKEPNLISEENPPAIAPVDMEAMKFEPLAAVENMANARKEDIDMTLYNEETENPVWNVTVAGIPAARIQLKKQAHPEEIRAVFCSDDYAKDLIIHCEKSGFVPTMNKVKAEFWSNYTSNKKIADLFKAEAQASFESERKRLLATFKQDFRNCMNIVSAGMSKNFYPDMGNPLKEHMFANLRIVGLPEQTAVSCVEKSFTEGSAPYFDALFEKAEEYMNLTADARKEIAAAIAQGSAIEQKIVPELESAATLSDRLAQASVVPSMATSGSPLKVNSNLVMDTNDYKQQLKSVWKV